MKDLMLVLTKQRDYRLVLSAALISLTGDWILRTALAFHVYLLTGSTLASGALLLASFLPLVLLGSLAGVFVDRWDRRRTMIVANLLNAAALLPLLLVHDKSLIWVVYAVVLVQSCLQQFFRPAEQSLIPALVEPRQLVTANALNSQTSDIARLVGAGVGGVLAGIGGLPVLALVDSGTFLASMLLLIGIRHRSDRPASPESPEGAVRRLKSDWLTGIKLCLASPAMRLVFVFGVVTGVGEGAMSTLFAPFVSTELGGDGTAYGLIVSSQAVGGIVGGLVAAAIGARWRATSMWGIGAVLFGLVDLILFLYPLLIDSLVPAFICMVAVGLPGAFLVAGSMTVIQRLTDDASRGRVFGALFAAEGLALLVGISASGVLGELVGIIPVLVVQGLGFLVGGLVVLARRRILTTAGADRVEPADSPVPA